MPRELVIARAGSGFRITLVLRGIRASPRTRCLRPVRTSSDNGGTGRSDECSRRGAIVGASNGALIGRRCHHRLMRSASVCVLLALFLLLLPQSGMAAQLLTRAVVVDGPEIAGGRVFFMTSRGGGYVLRSVRPGRAPRTVWAGRVGGRAGHRLAGILFRLRGASLRSRPPSSALGETAALPTRQLGLPTSTTEAVSWRVPAPPSLDWPAAAAGSGKGLHTPLARCS